MIEHRKAASLSRGRVERRRGGKEQNVALATSRIGKHSIKMEAQEERIVDLSTSKTAGPSRLCSEMLNWLVVGSRSGQCTPIAELTNTG